MTEHRSSGASSKERVRVPCLSCQQTTWHEVECEVSSAGEDATGWWSRTRYQVVRCRGCNTPSFRQGYIDDNDEEEKEQLWPPRTRSRPFLSRASELPPRLYQIYGETERAVRGDQPVLAAVGIRAIVEAVCKHRRAKGKNLKQRIDSLVARGVLTKEQARVLHRARILGNTAAHEARPPNMFAVDAAMSIAEHLLMSVYLLRRVARDLKV